MQNFGFTLLYILKATKATLLSSTLILESDLNTISLKISHPVPTAITGKTDLKIITKILLKMEYKQPIRLKIASAPYLW